MNATFNVEKKTFTNENGQTIEYYVLTRKLIDGSEISVAIKGDKAKLLLLSLAVEKAKKE